MTRSIIATGNTSKKSVWRGWNLKLTLCVLLLLLTFALGEKNSTETHSEKKKGCDKKCFNECTQDKDLNVCGSECDCDKEAKELATELTKNERCWGQCRQNCVLEMFNPKSPKDTTAAPGDCFGNCSCICNRGCTASCEKSPMKGFCLQSCGCPANKTISEDLLEKGEDYFKLPLDPRSGDELAVEFQGKLADVIAEKFNKTQEKEKVVLNKKLKKVEEKWNDYVKNADKLGLDPKVFCNQTCSHDCFLEADQTTYDILTGCLISKCQCFQPKLPQASEKISFEALLALKNIILSEEGETLNSEIITEKTIIAADTVEVKYPTKEDTEKASKEVKEEAKDTKQKADENAKDAKHEAKEKLSEAKHEADEKASEVKHKAEEKSEKVSESVKNATGTVGDSIKGTGEKVKEVAHNISEGATEKAGEVRDKVAEIAEEGKQKVKEIADSFTGSEDEKKKLDLPPTSVPSPKKSEDQKVLEDVPKIGENECNLTCFRECLDLKKFVPYPVIQQCINVRCHCTLDNTSEKLEALMQMASLNVVSSPEIVNEKPSVFVTFLLTAFILAILAGGATLLYLYFADKELRKRLSSEMEYTQEPGYERLA